MMFSIAPIAMFILGTSSSIVRGGTFWKILTCYSVPFCFYSCDAFSMLFALSLVTTARQQLRYCVLISKGYFREEHHGPIFIHIPRYIDPTFQVFPQIFHSETFIVLTNCLRLQLLIFFVPQHRDKNMLTLNMFLGTLMTCPIKETNTVYVPISPSNIKNISSMTLHVILDMMHRESISMMWDDTFVQH